MKRRMKDTCHTALSEHAVHRIGKQALTGKNTHSIPFKIVIFFLSILTFKSLFFVILRCSVTLDTKVWLYLFPACETAIVDKCVILTTPQLFHWPVCLPEVIHRAMLRNCATLFRNL